MAMQWTPEQVQWAEQHYDTTSSSLSPAHKAEGYHLQRVAMASASWANDDISALTASNLLKSYAQRYSALDMPLIGYPQSPALLANGKPDAEGWEEPGGVMYPMGGVVVGGEVSAGSLCSSPGVEAYAPYLQPPSPYTSPAPPPPPSAYLPACLAAPNPLLPPSYPSYAPSAPLPGCGPAGPLKARPFYPGAQVEMGGQSYGELGYPQPQPSSPALYAEADDRNANANAGANRAFKPANRASSGEGVVEAVTSPGFRNGSARSSANQNSSSRSEHSAAVFSFGSPVAVTTDSPTHTSAVVNSCSSSSSSSCSSSSSSSSAEDCLKARASAHMHMRTHSSYPRLDSDVAHTHMEAYATHWDITT
ncbi:fidgetin [Engraulis encrasicolus]|uniref:fidgetin n=1 Tax=Engraulis encrasicolus TaxID=184585 RepID=UPI002FD0CE36